MRVCGCYEEHDAVSTEDDGGRSECQACVSSKRHFPLSHRLCTDDFDDPRTHRKITLKLEPYLFAQQKFPSRVSTPQVVCVVDESVSTQPDVLVHPPLLNAPLRCHPPKTQSLSLNSRPCPSSPESTHRFVSLDSAARQGGRGRG